MMMRVCGRHVVFEEGFKLRDELLRARYPRYRRYAKHHKHSRQQHRTAGTSCSLRRTGGAITSVFVKSSR